MINYYWVSIKGKNTKQFLTNILKQNINIELIRYKNDEILIKVSYDDYKKLKQMKTSYKIIIVKTSGSRRLKQLYQKYRLSLFIFVISVFFIIFMLNKIFFINIETDNNKLKNLIKEELNKNNITLYTNKKSYNRLREITSVIKNNNLNSIEWIELEQKGVVLNVKVIPRVSKDIKEKTDYKDIIASKDGYIRKIYSRKGQLMKNIDDYVRKGEVIISGNIFRNDKVVGKVHADGKVYAEVWYIVKENKSVYYKKAIERDKGKLSLTLTVNKKDIDIIHIPKRVINPETINLFSNNIFSLKLKKEKLYVLENKKYDSFKLKQVLEERAKKELLKTLNKDEYIIAQKTLKKKIYNGKMYIEVFFRCYEDIAEEKDIQQIEEKKEE